MLNKLPGAGGDINIITQTGIGASASGVFPLQSKNIHNVH
jgi:hypothetical protein